MGLDPHGPPGQDFNLWHGLPILRSFGGLEGKLLSREVRPSRFTREVFYYPVWKRIDAGGTRK